MASLSKNDILQVLRNEWELTALAAVAVVLGFVLLFNCFAMVRRRPVSKGAALFVQAEPVIEDKDMAFLEEGPVAVAENAGLIAVPKKVTAAFTPQPAQPKPQPQPKPAQPKPAQPKPAQQQPQPAQPKPAAPAAPQPAAPPKPATTAAAVYFGGIVEVDAEHTAASLEIVRNNTTDNVMLGIGKGETYHGMSVKSATQTRITLVDADGKDVEIPLNQEKNLNLLAD